MCGRTNVPTFAAAYAASGIPPDQQPSRWEDKEAYARHWNVSPSGVLPVLRLAQDGGRKLHSMRWGLVPFFTKPDEKPDFWRMFNARSETVDTKNAFRHLLARKRCVVLISGFYEWKKEGGGPKQPYYVHLGEGGDRVMMVAGLYDTWTDDQGKRMHSVTMLTTDSSQRLVWLHDRMPAILTTPEQVAAWLGEDAPEAAKAADDTAAATAHAVQVLRKVVNPYNGGDLLWHPVTPAMSSAKYDRPDACKDMRAKKGAITAFFKPSPAKKAAAAAGSSGGTDGQGGKATAAVKQEAAPGASSGAGAGEAPAAAQQAVGVKAEPCAAAAAAPASDQPKVEAGGAAGEAAAAEAAAEAAEAAGLVRNTDDTGPGPQAGAEEAVAGAAAAAGSSKRPGAGGSESGAGAAKRTKAE